MKNELSHIRTKQGERVLETVTLPYSIYPKRWINQDIICKGGVS